MIEIIESINNNERNRYLFEIRGFNLLLVEFFYEKKASRRNKFEIKQKYNVFNFKDKNLTIQDVPLSDKIKTEALHKLLSMFSVTTELDILGN